MLKNISRICLCVCGLIPMVSYAGEADLVSALRATYTACAGIDNSLTELKKMAGINTAITGVGTGLGAGATIVGIIKSNKDEQARSIAQSVNYSKPYNLMPTQAEMDAIRAEFNSQKVEDEFARLRAQSKTLGNWRTGLMAGNTVTNIAGVIISSQNRVDDNLQGQIDNCKLSVSALEKSMAQAQLDGVDVTEATKIVNACKEYNYVDISKINQRGKGATIASAVGVATGAAGTITSAVANSESVRKDDAGIAGKTDADWDKEQNINTAANVLAGTSTVASAVATVFNAVQIKAIKDVANVAAKCTGVLK